MTLDKTELMAALNDAVQNRESGWGRPILIAAGPDNPLLGPMTIRAYPSALWTGYHGKAFHIIAECDNDMLDQLAADPELIEDFAERLQQQHLN